MAVYGVHTLNIHNWVLMYSCVMTVQVFGAIHWVRAACDQNLPPDHSIVIHILSGSMGLAFLSEVILITAGL